MTSEKKNQTKGRWATFIIFTSAILILSTLVGCGPSTAELATVNYTPLPGDDWPVSTPEEQGLDPDLVAEFYHNASELDTIYSLLIIKDGHLIAEGYFNEGSYEQKAFIQSISKSYISALVGLALDQGCLTGVDQKMMEFFPEFADQITDPRKEQITIQDLLQMRSGYAWEETHEDLWAGLASGDYMPLLVGFPLTHNPGDTFQYSNWTSWLLGVIVSRACDTDLKEYAQEHLLSPIGSDVGDWWSDDYGYYYSAFGFTARDLARFGILYLNDGEYDGKQVISQEWVNDSLQTYSEEAWTIRIGRNIKDIGYGYQWWSARSGDHHYDYAWGHGGQLIVLLDEFEMIIVLTADPFYGNHFESWPSEKANINLVADFIASLPGE
jgi:CubicO group peptidase (beta-lactamase class C family)